MLIDRGPDGRDHRGPGDPGEGGAGQQVAEVAVEEVQDLGVNAGRHDRPAQQERINTVPHFTTEVDGLVVHFIHVRSPHAGATPLPFAHIYPGSSVDYLDMTDV